jgi:hypothetical protein
VQAPWEQPGPLPSNGPPRGPEHAEPISEVAYRRYRYRFRCAGERRRSADQGLQQDRQLSADITRIRIKERELQLTCQEGTMDCGRTALRGAVHGFAVPDLGLTEKFFLNVDRPAAGLHHPTLVRVWVRVAADGGHCRHQAETDR